MNYAINTNLVRENYVKKKNFWNFACILPYVFLKMTLSQSTSFFFAVKIGVKHLLKKYSYITVLYNYYVQLIMTCRFMSKWNYEL